MDISQIALNFTELMNEAGAVATVTGPAFRVKADSQAAVPSVLHSQITAVGAGSPELDVLLQRSWDGVVWGTHITIAQQTGVGVATGNAATGAFRFVRVLATIGGTTPDITFVVTLIGMTVKEIDPT